MFRSRKKSKGDSASGPADMLRRVAARNLARVRVLGRWVMRGVIVLGLSAAIWGSFEIARNVRSDERFRLETWRIEVASLPEWVTPEIGEEITSVDLQISGERLSLFEKGILNKIKARMEATPWVEKVTRIHVGYPTLQDPGVLEMELRLRRPVALVEHGGLYYLADRTARRLGSPYRTAPRDWFDVPAITGLDSPGVLPQPGERWPSRDVEQGVEVARILHENGIQREFPGQPIHTIDLSNLHGRLNPRDSEITLWMGRQRLAWGRSPLSAGARTATTKDIVQNLRTVLSHPETYEDWSLIHLYRKPDAMTGIRERGPGLRG